MGGYNINRQLPVKKEHDDNVNEAIKSKEVLVISETGEQLGVIPTEQAIQMAYDRELDLVLVAAKAVPPVGKFMNYSKFRFEQQKKSKENKKNQKVVQLKEIRLSATIDKHDFDTKLKHAIKFLTSGDKVKVSIRISGRMITHTDIIRKVMINFKEALLEYAKIESDIKQEARTIIMVLGPKKE